MTGKDELGEERDFDNKDFEDRFFYNKDLTSNELQITEEAYMNQQEIMALSLGKHIKGGEKPILEGTGGPSECMDSPSISFSMKGNQLNH